MTGEHLFPDSAHIASLIRDTYLRISTHLLSTRWVYDENLRCYLKCEQEQETGSFKWRGALSKLSLYPAGTKIVTASTGNHGLAVALAAVRFGLQAKIFLPSTAARPKIEKLNSLGADLNFIEGDSLDAELAGKRYAQESDLPWVSPYNDPDVIAGQGTIGLELIETLQSVDRIYITVGGGGLISGIAAWIKTTWPDTEIIGCQPVHSPEMYLSVKAGRVVTAPEAQPTLSDGSAGPLEEDSITYPLCANLIDRFTLITEQEIKQAIRYAHDVHQMKIEGAAGVALASALKEQHVKTDKSSVVILCGGNIDPDLHRQIISGV